MEENMEKADRQKKKMDYETLEKKLLAHF